MADYRVLEGVALCLARAVFASKGYPFKNIFDFTTAGDWDSVAAVERLPALHYSVQVRIQRGDRGSGPPPPWKITSYMGFYRE